MKLSYTDAANESGKTILIYGGSGAGKTYFAARAPKPLYIDIEGGKLTILKMKLKLPILEPTSYPEIVEILSIFSMGTPEPEGYKVKIDGQVLHFNSIIIDTVDEMGRKVMQSILKDAKKEIPVFEQWNLCITRIRNLLESFRNLSRKGVNVFFLCHEELEKSDLTKIVKGQPAIFGKLSEEIQAMVDIVFHLTVVNGVRQVDAQPVGIWGGKDRTGSILKTEAADFDTIWKKLSAS